jgi:MORN repeat
LQIWRDGSIYEGEFFSGKPHGKGRLIHASHSVNQTIQDQINQEGDQTQESDNLNSPTSGCDIYEGEWLDGKAHGFGDYCNSNGTTYKGFWVADRQHGDGLETWPDGSYYKGPYIAGKKHGE